MHGMIHIFNGKIQNFFVIISYHCTMIELLGVLSLVLCLPALCNGRQQVVDLTYVLNKDTFRWLDVDPFNLTIVNRGIADFSGKDLW